MSNPSHEKLKEDAIAAIQELHSDTSVTIAQTLESLQEVAGLLDSVIAATQSDLE